MIKVKSIVDVNLYGIERAVESMEIDGHIYRKSEVWSYEREWRLVEEFEGQPNAAFVDRPILPNHIKAIIFGCRATEDTIAEICLLAKHFDPQIAFYKMEQSTTSYELRPMPIERPIAA